MNDIPPTDNEENGKFRPFAEFLVSLQFLTRLPIPFARTIDPPRLAQSMRFFAVAGAFVGGLSGLMLVVLQMIHLPTLIAAAFTCMFGALMTGGLHEDGLADTADGFFGGKSREHRLEIMRDSRIGSYGAMALGLGLIARAGAYESLCALSPFQIVLITAAVGGFSRAMMVDMMWATRPARKDGLSVLAGRPGRNTALFAIVCGSALTIYAGLSLRIESGFIALLVAIITTGILRRMAMRLIGGQTGDVCGAVQVVAEIMMLASFTAMIG
jgi:adenosylcobinamide-GDP ribazoletransferase